MRERLSLQSENPARLICNVLAQAGIRHVFGIPGGQSGHIWAALEEFQNDIRTILVREESLAAAMAEVLGRETTVPGVVVGQGPWVMGNGLIGILEAKLSSTPLLLLTDLSDTPGLSLHGPYQSGTGGYGNWNARQAFEAVTKAVFEVHDPASAVRAVQLGLKHALSGQPGPVAVLFSGVAFTRSVEPDGLMRLYKSANLPRTRAVPHTDLLDQAAEHLSHAGSPVLIAGNGVRIARAFPELQDLAECVGCPVVTTPSGKGVFPEVHPLSLGVFGTFGTPAANACVSEADVVLVVGSKLTASDTCKANPALLNPERQTFIQIDIEPRNIDWTYPVDIALAGDARSTLPEMTNRILRKADLVGRAQEYRERYGLVNPLPAEIPGRMSPRQAINALRNALPDDAIVTCDAGENRIFMTHLYRTPRAGGFLQAAGAGPMGYAIPSAMGARLAHPDRPIVAVCGDGGFAMTMNGLMTALENDLPIVTLILNNGKLGWSAHIRGSSGTKFGAFDHAAIAQAMGCGSALVQTPEALSAALAQALAEGRPWVIDAHVSDEMTYHDITSPLMKGR